MVMKSLSLGGREHEPYFAPYANYCKKGWVIGKPREEKKAIV